jgi:PAS domain S-box-containing protein
LGFHLLRLTDVDTLNGSMKTQIRLFVSGLKATAAIFDRCNHHVQAVLARTIAQLDQTAAELDASQAQSDPACPTPEPLNESHLALVQRLAHLGYWELDLATHQMHWSVGLFTLHGLEPNHPHPTYEAFQAMIHAEDRQRLDQAIRQAIAQRSTYEAEYRILLGDGSVRSLLGKGEVVLNAAGEPIKLVGIEQDRTAAHVTELALEESERWNRTILSAIPDIIMVMDAEGQYLSFFQNQFSGQLIPLPAPTVTNLSITDVLPPEAAQQWRAAIQLALSTGEIQTYEQQIQFEDRVQYEEVRLIPAQPDRVVCIVRDISASKQAEMALQTSETKLRRLAENLPGMVYRYAVRADGTSVFPYVSSRCLEVYGVTAEAVMQDAQVLWATFHPDDIPNIHSTIAQSIQNPEQRFYLEHRILTPDGRLKWIQVATSLPERQANGDLIWDGVAIDVTARKQAEAALQSREEQLRLAVEFGQVAIWDWNVETGELIWNELTYQLMGYQPGAVAPTYELWLQAVHPEDRAAVCREIELALAEQRDFGIEYRVIHADGTERWLTDAGHGLYDAEGHVFRAVGIILDITQRKQTEVILQQVNVELEARVQQRTQELQQQTQLLQTILNSMADGVVVADLDGNMFLKNPAVEQITGSQIRAVEPEAWQETYGIYLADGVTPCPDQQIPLIRAMRGESLDEVEHILRNPAHPEGICLETAARPLYDTAQNLIGGLIVFRDVTERKRSQLELQKLAAIVENSKELIGLASLEGKSLYLNPAGQRLVGLADASTLHQRSVLEFLSPDAVRRFEQEALPTMQAQGYWQGEVMFRHLQTGEDIAIEQTLFLIKDVQTGQPLCMATISRDIRDRKQTERALRESETRFRNLFEATPNPIQGYDDNRRVIFWNRASEELYGYSRSDALGQPLEELIIPPTIRAEVVKAVDCWIANRGPAVPNGELRLQNQAGELIDVYSTHVMLTGADGKREMYCIDVDLRELKLAEQALRQLNAELETRVQERTLELEAAAETAKAANRAKTTFLANMSHELRTPLNAILGFSQLLYRDPSLDLDQQEQIEIINRSGEHLLALINDILAMSKIEAGQMSLTLKSFDLEALLFNLESLFRLKAEAKQINLVIRANVPQSIQTDESKLRQVLINLLSNAIKFTAAGSVILRASCTESDIEAESPTVKQPLLLRFEVEDTGFGIDPAEQAAVFEPFSQTQAGQKSQEGTGLGLAISRQFVELMGGKLGFTSRLGQGSTFYFTIPVGLGQDSDTAQTTRQIVGLETDQPDYRLLVVEDNRENCQFLVQLLRSVGFTVAAANNGQEGVELWQTWQPDLIWMDMRMPVLDGYAATRQIRELEAASPGHATKILALTASAFEDERAAILAAGCDDFIFKPTTAELLFEKIAEHLGVRYRYQTQAEPTSTPASDLLDATALQVMPADWIAQLHRAARIADEDLILDLLDQIPPDQQQLAQTLKQIVNELQLDQLIQLTGPS